MSSKKIPLANSSLNIPEYCRRYSECQRITKEGQNKVLVISVSIVGQSFKRIAMDVVGQLPKNEQGNRYVLVICDYVTRYPEVIH